MTAYEALTGKRYSDKIVVMGYSMVTFQVTSSTGSCGVGYFPALGSSNSAGRKIQGAPHRHECPPLAGFFFAPHAGGLTRT